jgi:hypothetical protein
VRQRCFAITREGRWQQHAPPLDSFLLIFFRPRGSASPFDWDTSQPSQSTTLNHFHHKAAFANVSDDFCSPRPHRQSLLETPSLPTADRGTNQKAEIVRMGLLGATKCHRHNRLCRKRRGLFKQQQQQGNTMASTTTILDYEDAVMFLQFHFHKAAILPAIDEQQEERDHDEATAAAPIMPSSSSAACHSGGLKRSPTCGSFSLVDCM